MFRFAVVVDSDLSPLDQVARHLVGHYQATEDVDSILIEGMDSPGGTLDDVALRLAKAGHQAVEVTATQVQAWRLLRDALKVAVTVAEAQGMLEDESVMKLLKAIWDAREEVVRL